jgi:hypothetical protein
MNPFNRSSRDGFDRFQRRLLAMQNGDTIHAADAAEETGLTVDVCQTVLTGLERAGLMTQRDDGRFVRHPLELKSA